MGLVIRVLHKAGSPLILPIHGMISPDLLIGKHTIFVVQLPRTKQMKIGHPLIAEKVRHHVFVRQIFQDMQTVTDNIHNQLRQTIPVKIHIIKLRVLYQVIQKCFVLHLHIPLIGKELFQINVSLFCRPDSLPAAERPIISIPVSTVRRGIAFFGINSIRFRCKIKLRTPFAYCLRRILQ